MNINVLYFDTLESTNTEAANQARQGADEGLCVIARQQTAGRGRHGRTWVSEPDAGLYFSIVLRPKIETKYLPLITLMTGVAVHDLLSSFRLKPDIKWVNDILIGDKKICGILAETVDTTAGMAVVVGIGINLNSDDFPNDVSATATSIQAELGGNAVPIRQLEQELATFFIYWYEVICGEDGPKKVINHWGYRSSYFSGKDVRVTLPNGTFEGVTDGLEENGALRVKTPDGSVTIVQAGDVERLRNI